MENVISYNYSFETEKYGGSLLNYKLEKKTINY